MTSVLFVCAGNICRSPTAEAVFRARAEAAGVDALVDSAGIGAWHIGDPPDSRTISHAAQRGYDLAPLRARQVTASDFGRFEHILAMDGQNLLGLTKLRRNAVHDIADVRLFLSYAASSGLQDVPDPYYGEADGFERVLDLVEAGVDGLLATISTQTGSS